MRKRELTLEQLRQRELALLERFKAFCQEEQISWCLCNGTLLGAVKYEGFIPWDDDIDVLVPRADYDRLVKRWRDEKQAKLLCPERERRYRYPFAKLCDMTTVKEEENLDNGLELGVCIDVFPLDVWGPCAEKQADQMGRYIRWLNFWKCRRAISRNPVKRCVKNLLLTLRDPVCRMLVGKMMKLASENVGKSAFDKLGCVVWCIYGRREILPAEVFSRFVPVKFEGEIYPAPVGYDTCLRSLYGSYRQDPPPERQVSHHRFQAWEWEAEL